MAIGGKLKYAPGARIKFGFMGCLLLELVYNILIKQYKYHHNFIHGLKIISTNNKRQNSIYLLTMRNLHKHT
ncbi:hypothetical protein BC643_4611 [Mangrovibacterium diazotrophicum]|uniref:Uncharacterized protein n=1 Tax=Mangrovibacterium diazotrophicum TaxID=1261403 RepID=A0A419VUF4_9BACT|nr:hypothetical protein BC643_4611 [Mangrovibacterium diazotrophicum]